METKPDKVLEARLPGDYLIARVGDNNILSVCALEATAMSVSPAKLMDYKNVLIVTKDKLVAVGVIENVYDYNPSEYSHIFNLKNTTGRPWLSTVKFSNTILLGQNVKDVFGATTNIKYVQNKMSLTTMNELAQLVKAINTSYLFHINNALSSMGVV